MNAYQKFCQKGRLLNKSYFQNNFKIGWQQNEKHHFQGFMSLFCKCFKGQIHACAGGVENN